MEGDTNEGSLTEEEGAYESDSVAPADDSGAEEAEASADEISAAARKAFKSMAGRSEFKMRFTPSGLVIDNRMTFK